MKETFTEIDKSYLIKTVIDSSDSDNSITLEIWDMLRKKIIGRIFKKLANTTLVECTEYLFPTINIINSFKIRMSYLKEMNFEFHLSEFLNLIYLALN